ncbi:MAG: membrane protein insertase YidC, partial [Clostridiales bacterium]|nr:membrane protein insertase YidC [Clostridiales bacterium]
LAIIILSLAVNFLVLPLYKRADEVQKEERDLEASLAEGIAHIKKTFRGDERMMMLQTFYDQNNYSPLFVLKGSVSLLLQIPFFMAAYRFLSNLMLLKGVSFGPIHDLGSPDHMFDIGGIPINVLPILMTLINFISGYIYTKDMPLKSKIQLYGMALLFLVLLYNSPSGLAFYWTLNNVFSMLKNVFMRFKRPGFALSLVSAFSGGLLILYVNTIYDTYLSRQLRLTAVGALLILPLVIMMIGRKLDGATFRKFKGPEYTKGNRNIFLLSGLFLTALTGFLIPSSVIKTSPSEFMNFIDLKSPNIYVIHAGLIAAGYFIIWGSVFFFLAGKKGRVLISLLWWALCPAFMVTYLFFGTDLGTISINFIYDQPFSYSHTLQILNLFLVIFASVVFIAVFKLSNKIAEGIAVIMTAALVVMTGTYMNSIAGEYKVNLAKWMSDNPRIPLSADGRNVMVLMIDRAPGYLVPYIFEEIPQLQEQFDGFTYYPNTLSYGNHTKFGAPALFGGYDYTPQAINEDTSRTLEQKQNEALSVMPFLFAGEGFEVSLINPPYAGYATPPDISVFSGEEYEGIEAYTTAGSGIENSFSFGHIQEELWERNFFCYSILKVSPLVIQNTIYNRGQYNRADIGYADEGAFTIPQIGLSVSQSTGVNDEFMGAYSVLSNLDSITEIETGVTGTFMYIDNETPHSTMLLQEPDYVPAQYVDNTEYDAEHADRFNEPVNGYFLDMSNYQNMRHYQSNVAAYIQLGQYFDYLREQGVWDNTRIIVVSDHAILHLDADMFASSTLIGNVTLDAYNPVLMVKDFGSTGFTVCDDLMTNADVPFLATNGIVNDPVNPFTGHPINMDGHNIPITVYDTPDWNVTDTEAGADALRFLPGDWYTFSGSNIFDTGSWEYDGVR